MKRSNHLVALGLLCASILGATADVAAEEYSPFPPAGVYDASDSAFERLLTIRRNGGFTLEVMQKGKPGNLRSGSGEGVLTDAPGGWRYGEGRCSMTLRRAAGGMQLHVEACASDWGDVPFDGKYALQGAGGAGGVASRAATATASSPALGKQTATPANTGLPSRRQLNDTWSSIDVGSVAGKAVIVMVKPVDSGTTGEILEHFSKAAFVVDTTSDYRTLSPANLARPPIGLVEIPLPPTRGDQGLEFEVECSDGKIEDVVVISIASQENAKPMTRRRASAWRLNDRLQAVEIKPASRVKCPVAQPGY
ncbi:hypothetical protein ASD79_17945 [Caulobacter sp. Root655]|uniref:hypothetical protein n=1 Tax=Caulobacter sp. Root655 TaxID=1736578 RepID=UPI0006FC7A89|nr:hypothetical protein [Caulobacter sp. Root655]KRA56241.1 hypothetical protein ASD79_17945 [Caulobacter sp. Root655]